MIRKFILKETQLIQELFFESILNNWLIEFSDTTLTIKIISQEVKMV